MIYRIEWMSTERHVEECEDIDKAIADAVHILKTEAIGTNVAILGPDGFFITLYSGRNSR